MSIFKDTLANDVLIFMNSEEFAEIHTITTYDQQKKRTDRKLPVIIESFTLDGRPIEHAEGVSVHNAVVFIDPDVLAYTPRVDQDFYLDFMKYIVVDVSNEFGILKIALRANGTRP
ncbi:hypothetical protein [Paenibacillus macquariensis]|uniref:Uncharacterized protein n=1 Tax=Paenibacillus macquariensis TaxID=948756 RepID=A0ABY1K7A3_9BACL|nr:hypothetical protein [Paenibacillus macquariensis]MEC0092496.1 hypothetical protein [Paenibacillus macquariensis]OAB35454.1 hypothetical protein PMSM_09365 [Paenibacillus macquariensis subsp. macquariensis]SIR35397.1 hypothetical protein SAMN05421578_111170 [Paenibacillus macquariensis]